MYYFPSGKSNFKILRKEGYVYVDKTAYIEKLENLRKQSIHFLRPRRFGKSLFTSMLACYYDVNMSDEFDEIFQGTYIYDHPTQKRSQYYVLKFNFSGVGGNYKESAEKAFKRKVINGLKEFTIHYNFKVPILEEESASGILSSFLVDCVAYIEDKKIYVIIDEYDQYANDMLSFAFDEFSKATRSDGYIRAFYEELKAGSEKVIDQIFITGVSPITIDSLTSGFNISTNLSLDSEFNEMMGFTSEEMSHLISLVDNIKNPEVILDKMKQVYDGYIFSKEAEVHLYNPNMALYYLDYYQRKGKEPESLIDPNIYSDYNKIRNLLTIKPSEEQRDALLEIITEGKLSCRLTLSFDLQKDFSRDDFVSLLYYLGYLTIQSTLLDKLTLAVPNDVIRSVYFDYFNEMMNKKYDVYTKDYEIAVEKLLMEQKNDKLVACTEQTLTALDNRDFLSFNEKIVKAILTSILTPSNYLLLKNEYPVDKGYIDLALFPRNVKAPIMFIELKYIKANEFNSLTLQKKRKEAELQLMNYSSASEFKDNDIIRWILIFSKNKCVLNEKIN